MLHPAASLLGVSLSLLFISSKAFLEVGVSSYLNTAVYHVSETKWTLVKPWTVTSRKGFFEATASRGEGFRDRFHTPESGIYFIALNLQMAIATSGFLKASLVINGEFEEANGFQGVYGKTNLTETVSLSGLLRLYENDVLALYLYGSEGSLLRDSTFSVMQMSRIGAVPGFHAVLSRGQLIQPHVVRRLESWRTSGIKGLFSMHTGTSPSVGLFCAILEGIYQFSSNINVESNVQLTDGFFALELNSKITLAKRYLSGTRKYSSSISGMFQLNRGDCVEMRAKLTSGGHFTVLSGSSFSGFFLGLKREFAQQFSASLLAQNKVGSHVGWNMADNWTINSSRRNFQSQEMILKTNHSTFIANDNGLFLVTALINVKSSSRTSKLLLVAIEHPPSGLTANNGLSAGNTFSSSRGSLFVSGIVSLDKGDAVTVYVHSDSNGSDVVDGLFCVSVISYDWPGVTATLTESISLNTSEWTKVTTWKTHGVPGLFSFDNAFFPASGIYHSRQEGTYFVSCNVILKGGGKGNLSVVIAIDDLIDTGNGLYALNENPKPVVTLNVAGSLRLKMRQTVSVYVKTTISSSWDVSSETGFSVMLIGADSLTTPGFFAVKQEERDQSSSCGEIGSWRTVQPVSDTFFKAQFNSTSGRFKAEEDGFYLTSANILIRHSGITQIKMTIELGGQDGQPDITIGKTFQPIPSSSPSGGFVSTLTLASAGRLGPDQYVSIFIEVECQSGSHWKVLTNSSFSVVLVSRWESDYTAGFMTKNNSPEFGGKGFVEVFYWMDPNLFSKNLKVPRFQPVTIENNGLYFLSSVVILNDLSGGKTFYSGVCIDKKIAFNGITASKVSEGHSGNFAVSAFGVLYLRKGQRVYLCVSSGPNDNYKKESGSWFVLVRFLPLRQPPGLHQMLQKSRNTSAPCEWSVVRSMSTGGGQLAYINNNISHPNYPRLSCDKGDFTPYFNGAYLISVWFTLRGNLPDTVTACVGRRTCAECFLEFSNTVKQYSNTFGLVGLVDLEKRELISMCLKSNDHTFSILTATRSVQFLGGVELNGTFQLKHGSLVLNFIGWHALADWETNSNKAVDKFNVVESGLYILSINLQLEVDIDRLVGVKLETTGSSNREVLSILANFEADSTVSYSMAVVARMNASEAIAVSVYSNIKSLASMRNARFFAALVEKSNQFYCLSLRAKTSRYNSGDWWKPIENWVNVDTQCLSTQSSFSKGIFVADVAGVYFLTAVVMVKTSGLSQQTRLVELLLAVNGDTSNGNGLTATKSVMDSLSVVLSLSATAYLEPWQALSLVIRSTGVGAFDVVNESMFSVVLLEKAKYYKTVAPNITHFDNGPRVVRHPPPSVSLGEDLGLDVSWSCDAIAGGNVAYSWLKNDQNITSSQDLSLKNVQASDSGRYVCLAEYDSIKVFSQASELDVYDTSPQFQNEVFTALENSNASVELTFSALDKQRRPANISLDIIKGDTNNTFVLSRAVSKDHFTLRNQIPLDYEKINSYLLTLLAINQDTNKTTTVNVTINISDVNDNPPIFSNRSYDVSVEENVANGTVIFQAKATDEDSGNNAKITYTLLSRECDQNFFVDASSGNVTVTGTLDHETASEVILCIQATDGKFRTTTKLEITVMDVNEFAPVFNSQFYQRRISETALVGEPVIQVFATDKDSRKDCSIFYNITGGNVDDTFSIDPENGTIVLLKSLDYETRKLYELHVQASDGKFSSGTNVAIQVVDYNDNSPVFGQARFSFSVPENVTTGHLVGNVSASDKDSYDNANIHYSISSVGNYDKFIINSSTGDIFTDTKLDTETVGNYVILVTANDTGNPSRISTALVTITATDVNDNIPKFVQRNFTVNISEASVLGTNIVCLSTTDPDSMRHSEITYSITNGNVDDTFKVTAEGVVVLQKQLDRETVVLYNLTIVAGNSGAAVPQSHVPAIVIINVVDVNDNSPVFQKLNYSFTVPENVPERYFVGSVKASDRDSFDNSHISYSIPSLSDHEKFWINTSTGEIYTNGVLDYEAAENYAILVEAHDSGHPPRMAVTLVKIAITDTNDSPPKFAVCPKIKIVSVEQTEQESEMFLVSTTDADHGSNANVTYSIVGEETFPKHCESENGLFQIRHNGSIYNLMELQAACTYSINISATDGVKFDFCSVDVNVMAKPGTNATQAVHTNPNRTTVVNVTEGESLTVNCSTGTDDPEWKRKDGGDLETTTRKTAGVLLRIENASIADTGVYECSSKGQFHTIWVQVLVQVEVEMELVVENYVFTEELKNKSSEVYKAVEQNFTAEMDKVHRGVTPGYERTDVLGFKKGSVQVDFKIIIVLVTNDPENETDLPDVKAKTAQRVVKRAETGFVEKLQVKKVIVKTVPLEPANVEIFGIDSDELSVRWNPSEDANAFQVQKYLVEHRKFEDKRYTNASQPASDGKTQYTIRIQPLEPETTYLVRVGAQNAYGSNYNDESAHKTDASPFAWWIIVVVVLIILLVLVILVVLIVYKRKRDREREAQRQGPRIDALELEPPTHEIAVYENRNVKGLAYSYSKDAYKPSEVSWEEIPYEKLKLLDELGSGAFGVVFKAEYLQENGNVLPCAVKSLKPSASRQEVRDLYNELQIMDNVGYHPNLVNLIGACTEDGHLLVVIEIAENGSLIEFLKKNRQTDQSYEINSGLTEQMKTRIATDVARGMAHLAKCRCIHRDLAARNVLLGKDYIAKVSDYGMARDVYEDLMYKKETQGKLPVKWMAIESLQTYTFTLESDVWSYGVLLWEIESGGLKPYAGLSTTELMEELKKGYRLEKPAGCSEEMYQVMRSCWNPNPSGRPTFDQLVIHLEREIVT